MTNYCNRRTVLSSVRLSNSLKQIMPKHKIIYELYSKTAVPPPGLFKI